MSNLRDSEHPEHPGEHLKNLLNERGLKQIDLAFILGESSANKINTIINGTRGISLEVSIALAEALLLPREYFIDLQKKFDLSKLNTPDPTISIRAAMQNRYPVREMIKRGWIQDGSAENLQKQIAAFFEVANAGEIPYIAHSAKKSSYAPGSTTPIQLAWLFRVRQIAKSLPVPKYSESKLLEAIDRMKDLAVAPEEARHVPRLLTECGVRFVIVESLPQGKIDGVCFWLDKKSPVIGMSMRYDRIDNFWFVLRHEIEHILNKDGMDEAVIDNFDDKHTGDIPIEEVKANAAASNFCVPVEKLDSFIKRKHPAYYERDVLAFSKLHGVHPGVVVGQLQHRMNRYDYLRKHQVKIRHCVLPCAIADGWGQNFPIFGEK